MCDVYGCDVAVPAAPADECRCAPLLGLGACRCLLRVLCPLPRQPFLTAGWPPAVAAGSTPPPPAATSRTCSPRATQSHPAGRLLRGARSFPGPAALAPSRRRLPAPPRPQTTAAWRRTARSAASSGPPRATCAWRWSSSRCAAVGARLCVAFADAGAPSGPGACFHLHRIPLAAPHSRRADGKSHRLHRPLAHSIHLN